MRVRRTIARLLLPVPLLAAATVFLFTSEPVRGIDLGASRLVKAESFPEAMTELSMYNKFADAVQVPILANITEFGATPLFTVAELKSVDVAMVLYPLTAFRAMNAAALKVFQAVRKEGTQKNVIDTMQTRNELYDFLDYHAYEQKLDQLFAKGREK